MEENSNNKQNPEESKNPLLAALETIISGNEEIKLQQQKISQNQEHILQGISTKENRLEKENAALENLSKKISADIQTGSRENLDKIQNLFNTEHEKLKSVEFKISGQDRNLINKIESIFKKYWIVPVIIAVISLLLAGLTTYAALKFYQESVKSKGELRETLINNWRSQNKRLVDDDEWNALINERIIIQNFVKDNDNEGKALINYRKGMVKNNKGKAIYKDIDSDRVVKE